MSRLRAASIFIMSILYYFEDGQEVIEVSDLDQKAYPLPLTKIFESLCIKEFTTLKGRIDAIKKIYGYSYNVPIYISSDLVFFKIKGENVFWVNLFEVGNIIKSEKGTDIVFKGGKILKTSTLYRSVVNSYKKALRVIQD